MRRWATAVLLIGIVLLFFVANRGAYKGYFQADDLDNLAWTPALSGTDFLAGLVSPVFSRNNFRPVGHFYFHVMESRAGLRFPPYVAVLQLLHLLNGGLIWLVLRRLKMQPMAALAGTLFFLFHAATFDAYWQPMYVFDVFCGTFCLLSFLAFANRRWVLSFVCFWLAYKSKEVAVMLPAVLALYEFVLGEKKWKPLVPFFLVSLSFGLQALITNAGTNDAYTLKLSGTTLLNAVLFYLPKFLLAGAATLAAVLAIVFLKDRRAWIGVGAALLFLVPLLALPNRMYSVYLYVPLLGAAIAVAAILDRTKAYGALLFLAIWLPVTYVQMREYRKGALTVADENRAYVAGLADFVHSSPQTSAFIEDGAPESMHPWGIEGALRCLTKKPAIQLASINSPEAKAILAQKDVAVLSWDAGSRKVQVTHRDASSPDASYVSIRRGMPIWQFGDGWYGRENLYRWTKPNALVTLMRPEGAKQFEVSVNIGPVHIREVGKLKLEILVNGESIGEQEFTVSGWQKRIFPLKPAPAGLVSVEFRSSPTYHPANDGRSLGIAVGGFGFTP
jgi:hypothetical protein